MDKPTSKLKVNRLVVALALVLSFSVNFDSAVVIPLIANYAVLLGASVSLAGLIVGAYSMVHIPSNVISGRIVDKVGRKKPMVIGLLLDGLSLLLYSLADSPLFLLIARILHGLGGGLGGPATMAYVGDLIPRGTGGRGMALYGISVAFAMLFGFVIGGVGGYFLGYVLLFRYVAYFLFAMTILSLVLPSFYECVEERFSLTEEISVFKKVISRLDLLPSYVSIFAVNFVLGVITTVYAISLKKFGYSDAYVGMFFALMVLFSIVIHYPAGYIGDRIGKIKIMVIGLLLVILSLSVISISSSFASVLISMVTLGLGHGLVYPTSAGLIRDRINRNLLGLATGLFYGLLVAGIAVGAPLSGLLFERFSYLYSIHSGSLVTIFAILIALILDRRYR